MDTPFLPSLSLEKMSGLLASLLGTNRVTKSQHGRCGKGPLRLLRILSQVLNISQVGGYNKFQCLPPSSQYIGLRWAHSAGIPEAEFLSLFCGGTKIFWSLMDRGWDCQPNPVTCSLQSQDLFTANKIMKFYKSRKLKKKKKSLCIQLSFPGGQVLNQYLH